MKIHFLHLCLFFLFLPLQAWPAEKVQINISNLEDLTEKIKDLWSEDLAKPIIVPAVEIKECVKIDLKCLLGETKLKLIKTSQDFDFKIEAMPGQTFIYSLELPKAVGETTMLIRGKVLGRAFDLKFKIEASSISTSKEMMFPLPSKEDGPDIDWLKGSGKLFLELKNNVFSASSINFPHWKIDHLKITPTDRMAEIFMATFGRFADLEKLALGILNTQVQIYLQDANLHQTFAKTLNSLFLKIPDLLSSLKSYGVKASLLPSYFSTGERKISIQMSSDFKPTLTAHSCAGGLEANPSVSSLRTLLFKNSSLSLQEANAIKVSWPLSFFENAIFLMAKYPLLDRQGKPTPPLLCQNGQSQITILGKKQTFNYRFVPIRNISLKVDDKNNPGELILNLWAEFQGESDHYPKLSFHHKENGKKTPGLLVNLDVHLGLSLTKKGLIFEFKNLSFKNVIGKARLKLPLPLLSIPVPMSKIKTDLEKAILAYIENNITKMILLSPDINISQGHSLVLSEVELSSKDISTTLVLK